MHKQLVDVIVHYDQYGIITPLYIHFNDLSFPIDKATYLGNRYSLCGGAGTCWLIKIHGQQRQIFKDIIKNHWFIESLKDD